jgi:hypothetical protein
MVRFDLIILFFHICYLIFQRLGLAGHAVSQGQRQSHGQRRQISIPDHGQVRVRSPEDLSDRYALLTFLTYKYTSFLFMCLFMYFDFLQLRDDGVYVHKDFVQF